jgi:glycosyltransferase involved in cell wall biosynthesis
MKILYDYAAFMMQPRGGVSRVMHELIKYGLEQPDVDCRVWAGLHQNADFNELAAKHSNQLHGICIPERFAKFRVLNPLDRMLFPSYAKKFNPDICHYTFFMTPRVPSGTKVVITVHDLINELFAEHFPSGDFQSHLRKNALAKADGVVCVSEQTRADLLSIYDVDESKVVVAYNGNSMASVANPIVPSVDFRYFLYVGSRNGWRKNFEVVLKALASASELSEFRLVCFGGGGFSNQEKSLIKSAKLEGRVLQTAGSDSVLAGYYSNAEALIYPSRYEGFGLPPIEAMTFGCPVLASSAPPMPEIIGNAGLFFDPESAEELSNCLKLVSTNVSETEQLVLLGIERSKMFTWERSCSKVHSLYSSLID